MTNGTSQGLFVIVAVVIFGIFVLISYVLFKDSLQPKLTSIFCESFTQVGEQTGFVKGSCGVDKDSSGNLDTSNLREVKEMRGNISLNYSADVVRKNKVTGETEVIEAFGTLYVRLNKDELFSSDENSPDMALFDIKLNKDVFNNVDENDTFSLLRIYNDYGEYGGTYWNPNEYIEETNTYIPMEIGDYKITLDNETEFKMTPAEYSDNHEIVISSYEKGLRKQYFENTNTYYEISVFTPNIYFEVYQDIIQTIQLSTKNKVREVPCKVRIYASLMG